MQLVDQGIHRGDGVLFGDLAQLGVTGGGGGTGVAKQHLNMAQTQALFEQMGGKGMALIPSSE